MKTIIIKKTMLRIGLALASSIIYMQLIAASYMSISWPLSFFASLFLGITWFHYLKYDGINFFIKIPKISKNKSNKSLVDYVDTDVKNIEDLSQKELQLVNLVVNLISGIIIVILALIL
jgi:hypothetical protein